MPWLLLDSTQLNPTPTQLNAFPCALSLSASVGAGSVESTCFRSVGSQLEDDDEDESTTTTTAAAAAAPPPPPPA